MATAPRPVPKAVPKAVPPAEASAPAPKGKSKKKLIVIAVLGVVLLSAGGWFYLQKSAHAKNAKPEAAPPPVFAVMEPFTVNLISETGSEQFLQVAFTLQVNSAAEVDSLKLYMPQVRSRILLLLSGKSASQLTNIEGKKKLADEIMAQVRLPFAPNAPTLNPGNVFFTSFVIQ